MHALFRLIADRPQLVAEHAEAYAALVTAEVPRISAAWRRSAVLHALAVCSAVVGIALAGVSAMLWAITPDLPAHAPWLLVAVPLLPLLSGLAFALAARSGRGREGADRLRRQIRADILMLREAAAP
jgi:hypothetical protein